MNTLTHSLCPAIGKYGDDVESPSGARWLVTSGTPVLAFLLDETFRDDNTRSGGIAWLPHIAMPDAPHDCPHLVKVTHI